MNTTKTLMAIATVLAMTGCALPVARSPGNGAELNMLDKALEGASLTPPAANRTAADASDGNSAQMSKTRLSLKPDDNLNRLYSADYNGPPSGILQDIADTVGWRFEQRGAPDANAVVRVRSASQPAMAVLRSIGEQFPYALVVDERAKSIMLDYTRLIIDPQGASKPQPQKYSMDGGIFSSRRLAVRIADGYKRKGFDCQIKTIGRKFQIQLGPFTDDGSGERKVRDALGPLKRVSQAA
ncbi:DotD/TraH family lipoprotein [Chromobacterium vaccinii]|uniref:DotD/TraH family lipoprotein n=1 Tax=Chromobacterium vaccinii TaxID=1108595 RepID=UPI0031E1FE27